MNKTSGQLMDEVNFIIDGIRQNCISGSEAARSATIGALTTALAGAGIGALIGSKKNKKGKKSIGRNAMWGAIYGALAGGAAGPVYAQLRKYLDGVKFDNSVFDKTKHEKGDKVYIGVAGSANGENESWFAKEMRNRFGRNNVVMLRHVDDIQEKYNELKAKGFDVTVVGHSSGGASAAKFLRGNPDAKGYLIDPVSWFGRGVPNNAVVFTSDKSTRHGGPFENTIADLGGRWNVTGDRSVVFKGSHSNRMHDILRDYVAPGITGTDKNRKSPDYVTSEFGIGKSAQAPGFFYNYDMVQREAEKQQFLNNIAASIKHMLENPSTLEDTASKAEGESDPYYYNILVGGANAGGKGINGLSDLPFGVLAKGDNRKLFRHNQIDEIRAEIALAIKKGLHPRVVGHSWGGSTVANLAKYFPGVPFYAMDPVSWGNRLKETPANLTIYYPRTDSKTNPTLPTRLAPIVGRRWPRDIKGKGKIVEYYGDHVNGISDALTKMNNQVMLDRMSHKDDVASSSKGFEYKHTPLESVLSYTRYL